MRSPLFVGLVSFLFPAIVAAQALPLDVTSPADGALLNDATPTFAGTTQAAAEVTVSIGSTPFTVIANETGNWSVDSPTELEDGEQSATVSATDGVETASEVTVNFTIDTTPPALVVIAPTDGSYIEPTTTVSGNSDAGARVDVFVDDVLVGTTEVVDGPWEVTVPEDGEIGAGPHTITVTAVDEAGNESTLNLSVDVEPPLDTTDTDGDGLIDEVERTIGTDPESEDSDGDGLSDFEEFERYETNPLSTDTDNDGISDDAEVAAGTSPRLQDTDGGGVFDGVEVANGTNPQNPDDDYPDADGTAGNGCSSVPAAPQLWILLVLGLLFKRVRRR